MSARNEVLERDAVADRHAFYLQQAFRSLLDAMARPGEVALLPDADPAREDAAQAGLFAQTLVVADVLLDAAVTFAVAGARGDALGADVVAERVLASRSHARARAPQACGYAFLPMGVRGEAAAAFTSELCAGTLLDPQLGATLVVECGTLLGCDAAGERVGSASRAETAAGWELTGPGVSGTAQICCDRADALGARCMRGDEFPCGIDMVLVDAAGHVVAVPRTTALKGGSAWDM